MNEHRTGGRKLARWGARAVAAVLWMSWTGAPAVVAQEAPVTWVRQEKARIGIMLEEVCESPVTANAVCDRSPIVSSVVVDGPADRAGVQAKDTLLSVNGLDVTRTEGRAVLVDLQAGVPVRLEVGRDGGRRTIEVTPELRPAEPYVEVRTFFRTPDAVETGVENDADERVQIVRVPSVRRGLDEVELRLDSLRARGEGFVFFHEDTDGTFKVEVGDSQKAHVILERMREHMPDPGEVGVSVWENEDLARRLAIVRDSSLKSTRVHLDSLIRLRSQVFELTGDSLSPPVSLRTRVGPGGQWSYDVGTGAVPGQLRTLFLTDVRLGGAEFRELSAPLAEYFDGVDEGLLVLRVIPDTPADRMGLMDGDVVVEVNGEKCHDISTLRRAMIEAGPDGQVQVKWIRKGTSNVGELQPG